MKTSLALGVLMAVLVPSTALAELRLGSLFTDHMVLQRDVAVPVWGTADPGATITVGFAGQEKTTAAQADGKWMIKLDPLSASFEPRRMMVTSSLDSTTETQQCTDVLVGEVWICSGQSNMQFGVNAVPEVKALIPQTKNIRSFTVKRSVAFTEQERCEGEWVDRYPDSAVAFGFAHFLKASAETPVGIILSCWGSTSIEAWMPRDMTETVPHFKVMMEEFDANTEARDQIDAILSGPQPWSGKEDIFLRRQSNIIYNAMMH
ncbi:sialate O-acetylesterase, partial [Novipirellula maiorica]